MENMEIEDKRTGTFSKVNSLLCPMIGLIVVLIAITLALAAVLVHRSNTTILGTPGMRKLSLRERYPGYFRYFEEQAAFERIRRDIENVTSFVTEPGYNGSGHCGLNSPAFPVKPAFVIEYHACCKSNGSYISPEYWVDWLGINRTMAVFKDPVTGREAKQYFYTEKCDQVDGCSFNCQCGQREYHVTGVYVSGTDEYDVSFFPLPGCCKCYNY